MPNDRVAPRQSVTVNCEARAVSRAALEAYVTDKYSAICPHVLRYLHAFYVDDETVCEPRHRQYGRLNIRQLACILDFLSTDARQPNSGILDRTTALVGPAGTGKTATLIHAVRALCNSSEASTNLRSVPRIMEQYQGNPRFIPRKNGAVLDAIRDNVNVLVLTSSNNALDVLEKDILNGIPILVGVGSSFSVENVIPVYKRMDVRRRTQASLPDKVVNIQRRRSRHMPRGHLIEEYACITMSTFGSLQQLLEVEVDKPFTHIFLDEASQTSDSEVYLALHELQQVIEHNAPFPPFLVLGDPMQQAPILLGPNNLFSKFIVCPGSSG